METLAEIAARLRTAFDHKSAAREGALMGCRQVIRIASTAIRSLHRLEFENARALLAECRESVEAVKELLRDHPDLYHAGYVHDSQKEYVEAEAMYAIVRDMPLPGPEELGVEYPAYLNGLAEAGSECRRYLLDRLRRGETVAADRSMAVMDDIYHELIAFDYPDAMTGNLRRTTDAFRAVLERTRGDLALTARQQSLEDALRQAEARLRDSGDQDPTSDNQA